jgi:signal transduction histidine kinase
MMMLHRFFCFECVIFIRKVLQKIPYSFAQAFIVCPICFPFFNALLNDFYSCFLLFFLASDPQSQASCEFMKVAVHRSVDFAKSAHGVALQPALETVDLAAALGFTLRVVRQLHSSASIAVAPMPSDLCAAVVTDRHWLSENLLCLLGNAVKYSDGDGGAPIVVSATLTRSFLGPDDAIIQDDNDACCSLSVTPSPLLTPSQMPTLMPSVSSSTASPLSSSSVAISLPLQPAWSLSLSRQPALAGSSELDFSDAESARTPLQPALTALTMLRVTVADRGIGVSSHARARLFQPFSRAQSMAGGTGLGLFRCPCLLLVIRDKNARQSYTNAKRNSTA